ncbi:hypothetical protein BS47DRAFT_1373957 [Hydnum rufescens UP504]|uniref:cysteine-S-conjugate beta-lyase n=1 Tax=Hydnum rufescens UP504 TaxID=1448309 RepID=A0A9P6DMQ3_9AGAM|nr:hypothetical protein BS47DRAFT_1373957 [Hydnum rufescens UP504]
MSAGTIEDGDFQKDQYGSSSVPIYQTATFKGMNGEYDYTRSGNPTRSHLEHHIAKISSARHAFTVSSGMAALDVITRILKPGNEVIAGDDLYGGTNRLLSYLKTHAGVIVHHVDTTDPKAVLQFLTPSTAMVLLESPTNPLLKIVDLANIVLDVKERAPDAIVVVDNTMMSPYLQRPLEHGADLVYDSGTKYLSGHHDLMAGVITCNRDDLAKQIAFIINAVGNALTPFDSFLLLRGTKTLAIRMDRQQASAMRVASYLDRLGFQVHYPGLANHPGREIHERLANGFGAVLSFVTDDKEMSERIVGATRLWGYQCQLCMPCLMSHASIDASTRAARGLPEDLIRLCVGIEDSEDLLDDLEGALLEAGAITQITLPEGGVTYRRAFAGNGDVFGTPLEKLSNGVQGPAAQTAVTPGSTSPTETEFFVSAPGKVILFGEHAVVYGVTAIAAAVDLRCYGLVTPRSDGKLTLSLPDLDGFEHTWDVKQGLPWDSASSIPLNALHPEVLDLRLVEAITQRGLPPSGSYDPRAKAACIAFLYIYMTRSALPIGAGLGSSASYSACISTALLLLHSRISLPSEPPQTRGPTSADDPGHVHVSHRGFAEEVNKWAFISEKVLHGNPSGVDNAVAVYGGALAFTRAGFGKRSGMENIQGLQGPRDTKSLVAGVGYKREKVCLRCLPNSRLADPELSRETLLQGLSGLIDENHAHLASLGVSHASLETIREITTAKPYGLHTKLTGAGGGGCAVTLIPDSFRDISTSAVIASLKEAGFEPYLTSVGGSGLGVFPVPGHPSESTKRTTLHATFAEKPASELAAWANGKGRWLFV